MADHKIKIPDGEIGALVLNEAALSSKTAAPLILINGGPGGTYGDDPVLKPLGEDRAVIFYDQLGAYHSPAPLTPEMLAMPRYVTELQSLFNYFAIDQAILLGHSFGGCVATDFSLALPSRVKALILSSPLLSTPRWIEDANILLEEMPEKEKTIIKAALAGQDVDKKEYDAAEMIFYKRHLCRLDPWPQKLVDAFAKGNKEIYERMWGRSEFVCTGTLKNYDRFDELSGLAMPVLLTCGRYDEARPDTMKAAADRIAGARLHVFEQSGHCPYYDEPENYIRVIKEFAAAPG